MKHFILITLLTLSSLFCFAQFDIDMGNVTVENAATKQTKTLTVDGIDFNIEISRYGTWYVVYNETNPDGRQKKGYLGKPYGTINVNGKKHYVFGSNKSEVKRYVYVNRNNKLSTKKIE